MNHFEKRKIKKEVKKFKRNKPNKHNINFYENNYGIENYNEFRKKYQSWLAFNRQAKTPLSFQEYLKKPKYSRQLKGKSKKFFYQKRTLQIALATPKWVDVDKMAKFYGECPDGYHVDHIEPLNGKNSCGLHVAWNLQYLPAKINLKKSNN